MSEAGAPQLRRPRKWVVIFANGYGDSVIVRPTLHALSRLLPGHKTLLCQEGCHVFLKSDLPFDAVVPVEMWSSACGREFDVDRAAAAIGPCDGLIAMVPWKSESIRALRARLAPAVSIGHFAEFDVCIDVDPTVNNALLNFRFAELFEPMASIDAYWKPPVFGASVRDYVDGLLAELPADAPRYALHADTLAEKMWDDAAWEAVLSRFLRDHPRHLMIAVGRREPAFAPAAYADRVIPLMGLSLEASMYAVSRCAAFVGIDSCMLHAADAFGLPGLGIFRATDPHEFGFLRAPHVHATVDDRFACSVETCWNGLLAVEAIRAGGPILRDAACGRTSG